MAAALESTKTKIARRVIEVFEFFAEGHARATVMDIVRRYGRPQSSTSELLGSLVEMGLLYKDPQSRSYAPTPRLAALGTAAQPEPIHSGRLFGYMDRLAQTSRCGVGLFGVVGTHVQVFRWSPGADCDPPGVTCGAGALLSSGAIGRLLLASFGTGHASRMLWRLHAEADDAERFDLADAREDVARYADAGHAIGPSGFAPGVAAAAVLLPEQAGEGRLALAVLHPQSAAVDPGALIATLSHAVPQFLGAEPEEPHPFLRSLSAH